MMTQMCLKAMGNAYTLKNFEACQNQRLLDKQEKIESICTNLKQSAEIEDSEELQIQIQEIQDMVRISLFF